MLSRAESSCSRLGAASFELAKGLGAPRSLVSIFLAAILLIRDERCRGDVKDAVPFCVPVSAHQPALCYDVIRQSVQSCRFQDEFEDVRKRCSQNKTARSLTVTGQRNIAQMVTVVGRGCFDRSFVGRTTSSNFYRFSSGRRVKRTVVSSWIAVETRFTPNRPRFVRFFSCFLGIFLFFWFTLRFFPFFFCYAENINKKFVLCRVGSRAAPLPFCVGPG